MTLVKTSRHCVATAASALERIREGKAGEASKLLVAVRGDGDAIVNETEKLLKRFKATESYYIQRDEEMTRKIGELGRREQQLEKDKVAAQGRLEGKRSVVRDNENRLRTAQQNLEKAQQKKRREEQKSKDRQVAAVAGGILLGILTAGIGGAAVGAMGGAFAGAVLNDLIKDCERARDEVNRYSGEVDRSKRDVTASQQEVSSITSEIASLQRQIEDQKQNRLKCHQEVDNIKELIVFMKKARDFWGLFRVQADDGKSRAELLQKIVDKAKERQRWWNILGGSGTQTIATSFMEAWEKMETMCDDSSPYVGFQIEYQCFVCKKNTAGLPHVQDGTLVCNGCIQLQITS